MFFLYSGDVSTSSNVTSSRLTLGTPTTELTNTGDATVAGDLRTEGNKTVEGHLTVGNPATELTGNGDMTVAGSTRMEGNLRVDADADINNIYTKSEVDDLINGGGTDGQFNNLVVGNPNTELTGAGELTTASNARIEGGLNVTGGNISADQDLGVDGFARIGAPSNQLSGAGDLTVANNLRVEGNIEDHYTTTEVDNLLADKADTGQDENFSRLVVGNPNTELTGAGELTTAGNVRTEGDTRTQVLTADSQLFVNNGENIVDNKNKEMVVMTASPNGNDLQMKFLLQDLGLSTRTSMTAERTDVTFGSANQNPFAEFVQFVPPDPSVDNYRLRVQGTDGDGNFDQLSEFEIGRTLIGRPNNPLTDPWTLTVAGDQRVEGDMDCENNLTLGNSGQTGTVINHITADATPDASSLMQAQYRLQNTDGRNTWRLNLQLPNETGPPVAEMIYSVPADAANNNYKVELLGRDVGGTGDFTRWTDLEAGRIDARDTLVAQSNARVGNPNTTLTNNGDLTVAGDARLEGALELPNGNQGSSESTRFLQMGPATVGGFDIASSISVQSFQGPRSNMITNRPNVTFGTSNQNPVLEFVQFVPDDPSTENYLVRFAGTDGSGDFDQLADFLIGRTTIGRPNTELTGAGDLTVAGDLRVEGSNNITSSDGNFDTLTVGNPNTDLTANGTLTTAGDVRIEGNWTIDQSDRQAEFVPAGSFEGFDWLFTSPNTTGTKRIRFNQEFDTLALDDWQLRVGVSGPTANTNGLAVESNAVIGNPNTQLNNAGDLTVAGDLRVEGSNNIVGGDGDFDTLRVGNPNLGGTFFTGQVQVEGLSVISDTGTFPGGFTSAGENTLSVAGDIWLGQDLRMDGGFIRDGIVQADNSGNQAAANTPTFDRGSFAIWARGANSGAVNIGQETSDVTYNEQTPTTLFDSTTVASGTTTGSYVSIPGTWQIIGQISGRESNATTGLQSYMEDVILYLIYKRSD